LLAKRLQEKKLDYSVVNASISGETTSGGRTRIAAALDKALAAGRHRRARRQRRPARPAGGATARQPDGIVASAQKKKARC
jgi:hypothetical protein